jgi:hypothetical protein
MTGEEIDLVQKAIAAEREACAALADDIERARHDAVGDPRIPEFKPVIGAAIRARK